MGKKVLIVNNEWSFNGGAHVAALQHFEILQKNDYQVNFFCAVSFLNERESVEVVYRKGKGNLRLFSQLFDLKVLVKLISKIRSFKPDIIHIHLFKSNLSNSILVAPKLFKNIDYYFTYHDFSLIDSHSILVDNHGNIIDEIISGKVWRNITLKTTKNSYILSLFSYLDWKLARVLGYGDFKYNHIVVSQFSKNLLARSPYGADTHVLYNSTPRADIDAVEKLYDFIFVGRLSSEKGIKTLLELFSNNFKKAKLLVLGDGPLKPELIQNYNVYENIEFDFAENTEEVKKKIALCSWLILPSITYENNPLAIIEAMSCGVPALGSNHGGILELLELIQCAQYGFSSNHPEEIIRSLELALGTRKSDYIYLSNLARRVYNKHFSEDQYLQNLQKLYG